MSKKVPIFDSGQLEQICKVLADTEEGFTGSELGQLLAQCGVKDIDPKMTKWRRLYNALAERQNKDRHGAAVLKLIEEAMKPVRYVDKQEKFEDRKSKLNQILSFSGIKIQDDGKLVEAQKVKTIPEAKKRADKLRQELERRNVHPDVLKFCKAELVKKNYFHAVFEAVKSIADKIREKSDLTSDGAKLVDKAFGIGSSGHPKLAFNSLETETEKSEHKGFNNFLKGIFGLFRNTTAHEPKIKWEIEEEEAMDLMTMASYAHRKLDECVKTGM